MNTSQILYKSINGGSLSRQEALRLMNLRNAENIFSLLSTAYKVKSKYFGNKIFLYGFIYFSTYCRNSCKFCFYRSSNTKCPRYRKNIEEVVEIAKILKERGVHLVDLTMGEDPLIHSGRYDILVKLVKRVKEDVDISVMISPGVLPRSVLRKLAKAGADWYALYQETHNRELYSKLRVGQDYDERMKAKLNAKEEGLLIEEGILIGVGETETDRVNSVFVMKDIGAHQVRAMGFIPQPGTPMENVSCPPILDEMKTIAIMRLVHKDRLIPASLDIDGIKGLELRLIAGANVITSIIPPNFELKGVAQSELGIDEGLRSVDGVRPYVERLGLSIASRREYEKWVENEKEELSRK